MNITDSIYAGNALARPPACFALCPPRSVGAPSAGVKGQILATAAQPLRHPLPIPGDAGVTPVAGKAIAAQIDVVDFPPPLHRGWLRYRSTHPAVPLMLGNRFARQMGQVTRGE